MNHGLGRMEHGGYTLLTEWGWVPTSFGFGDLIGIWPLLQSLRPSIPKGVRLVQLLPGRGTSIRGQTSRARLGVGHRRWSLRLRVFQVFLISSLILLRVGFEAILGFVSHPNLSLAWPESGGSIPTFPTSSSLNSIVFPCGVLLLGKVLSPNNFPYFSGK